jgi:outer membrane protein OmpA-like peptidoglycan-associated protein
MQAAAPLAAGQYAGLVTLSYVHNPVVWRYPDGSYDPVVSSQVLTDLGFAWGFGHGLDVGAVLPIALAQSGASTSVSGLPSQRTSMSGAGLGDLRLVPRFAVLEVASAPVGVALAAEFTLPTGDRRRFRGEGNLSATPRLIITAPLTLGPQPLSVSASAGIHLRPTADNARVALGNELDVRAGAIAPLPTTLPLSVLAEVGASTAARRPLAGDGLANVEAIAGLRAIFGNLLLTAGGALGLSDGLGTPDYRVIVALGYGVPVAPPAPKKPRSLEGPSEGGGDEYSEPCPDVAPGVETELDRYGCPQPVIKPLPIPDARDLCAEGHCPNEERALTKYIPNVKIDIKSTILFETGRATIKPESQPILDEVAMQMLAHAEVHKIRVEGHTDSIGPEDDNLYLSQDRADSVRRYLIARGVAKERLVAVGYGLTRPIASNQTVSGRAKNRRVDFVIVE